MHSAVEFVPGVSTALGVLQKILTLCADFSDNTANVPRIATWARSLNTIIAQVGRSTAAMNALERDAIEDQTMLIVDLLNMLYFLLTRHDGAGGLRKWILASSFKKEFDVCQARINTLLPSLQVGLSSVALEQNAELLHHTTEMMRSQWVMDQKLDHVTRLLTKRSSQEQVLRASSPVLYKEKYAETRRT